MHALRRRRWQWPRAPSSRPARRGAAQAQRRRSAGARRSAVVSHSEASLADAARVHLANAERTARNLMALTTTRRRRADASRSLSGCSGRRAHLSRRLRPRRGNERAESDAVELAAALTVAADIARRDAEVVHVESSVGCRVLPCERKSSQRRAAARSGAQRPTIRLLSTVVTLLARARNRWGNTTPLSTMTSPRRNTGPGRRLDATTGARATQPMYMPSVRTRRAPSVRHRRRRGGGGRCAVDGHPGGRRASYRRRYCCCCCRCGGVATAYAKAEGG